jgi:hypothetical protein
MNLDDLDARIEERATKLGKRDKARCLRFTSKRSRRRSTPHCKRSDHCIGGNVEIALLHDRFKSMIVALRRCNIFDGDLTLARIRVAS